MHRKVAFYKVTTATGESYRPEKTRELAIETRRCKLAVEIWQAITGHTATYEVELDGRAYTITAADFTRRDDAKVAFRAAAAD